MGGWGRKAAIGIPVLFLLIQGVPYGRYHDNPPVVREPPWADAKLRSLVKRACFDCHSNETRWPAYSNIAPFSWLVRSDVSEGRSKLNFSDWKDGARNGEGAKEIREAVDDGEMPPLMYRLMHRTARLRAAERAMLIGGLAETVCR